MEAIKLNKEEISGLCMALSYLIHAGIATGDALALMAEDETSPAHKKLLQEMSLNADDGIPLAAVFRQAGCFPGYVCTLLEVGERVGKTEETLEALGRYYIGRARLNQRLRAALLYPAVLLVVLLAVVVILLVWVLPVFNDVYAQLGSSLTGFAGGLLALGQVLRRVMPVLGVILAVLVMFLILVAVLPDFRAKLLAFWRKRRGDSGVSETINTARFAQALSMALSSGLTALEAVELAASLSEGTPNFEKRCNACLAQVEDGRSLPAALRESELLPKYECRLLEAGMRSGSGEAVMEQVAQRLLEESELALEAKVSKVEPALVVVMSLMVGVILLSVMLPLMNIMTSIG